MHIRTCICMYVIKCIYFDKVYKHIHTYGYTICTYILSAYVAYMHTHTVMYTHLYAHMLIHFMDTYN